MAEKPTGPAGWTSEESQKRGAKRQEIPEQNTFATQLDRRGILYLKPHPYKKSTIRKGAPDFTVFVPHWNALCLEFKAPGAKQTEEQIAFMNAVREAGYRYEVVYSAKEAIRVLDEESFNGITRQHIAAKDY